MFGRVQYSYRGYRGYRGFLGDAGASSVLAQLTAALDAVERAIASGDKEAVRVTMNQFGDLLAAAWQAGLVIDDATNARITDVGARATAIQSGSGDGPAQARGPVRPVVSLPSPDPRLTTTYVPKPRGDKTVRPKGARVTTRQEVQQAKARRRWVPWLVGGAVVVAIIVKGT